MPSVTVSRTFNAPLARVFEVFTDIEHAAGRIPAITKIEPLTDQPFGVGYRWRETRLMMKREATETMTISEFEPNKRYIATADSCGCHYESEFRFTAEGAGRTRVDMMFTGRPVSFMAKVMSPMFFFMTGMLRKCLEQDFEALGKYLEGEAGSAGAAVAAG